MIVKLSSTLFQRITSCIYKDNVYKFNQSGALRRFSDWHLVGALCLERRAIITQQMTPLEQRYFQYLHRKEVENSYLSDHEKRHLDDLKNAEKMKKGEIEDIDSMAKQTAQDFEDACLEEFNKFHPNSRITDADMENNQKSIQRKLDSSLLLVVKQKIGNDYRWILPQAVHQKGETLKETAVRAFSEICPSSVALQMMGNAPVGYYKYKYPKAIREDGFCGAKVFFFKAQLLDNRLQNLDTVVDHRWLSHFETEAFLQPVYQKVVQSFLYPDTIETDDSTAKCLQVDEEEQVMKSSASN